MKTSLLIFITCFHSLVFAAPIDDSIKRGTQFLLEEQKPDGSWGGATRTKHLNIYAPGARAHLAFKNATTALCLTALKKSLSKDSAVQSAVARGYEYLVKTADEVKRVDGRWIGNVWTHAFTIQALLLYEDRTDKMDLIIKKQLGLLKSYQGLDGGWGYYDFKAQTLKPSGSSVSFLTGTVLIILM